MANPSQPVDVEVVFPLADYTLPQLILACGIQRALDRGKLILVEPPWSH